MSKPPAPAIVQCFARRAACGNPVPDTIWLRQSGEMRVNLGDPWRPFTAGQVISTHQPGFVWLARMQAAPLLSAHPRLLCAWRGSPRSSAFRFIAAGAGCGTTGGEGRIDALSRRTRMGATRHARQPAAI
jgi:hypothetical protein